MLQVQAARFPVVASVSGLAAAAGCQLVASCDLVIAGESASFSGGTLYCRSYTLILTVSFVRLSQFVCVSTFVVFDFKLDSLVT